MTRKEFTYSPTCDCNECKTYEKNMEIKTLNKKIYKMERWLDKYNHLMEFMRTMLAIATVSLQLIILYRLSV